jgi:hypothetical protein
LAGVAVGAVAALFALVVVVGGIGIGLRGGGGEGSDRPARAPAAPVRPGPETTVRAASDEPTVRADDRPLDAGDVVLVRAAPAREPATAPVVERLADGDVLHVRAEGFDPFTRTRVRQCTRVGLDFGACGNAFPVQTGGDGVAEFQYQVRGGRRECGPGAACVVVVGDDTRAAFAYTVFGAPAPAPASVRVTPAGPYRVGQRVEVSVEGLGRGAEVGLVYCAPECGPVRRLRADAAGRADGAVELSRRCGRGERCVVVATGLATRDLRVAVPFTSPPAARYETRRVAVGLGLAAALLALAWWVVRRTDWRPPTEAGTPLLDAAEL